MEHVSATSASLLRLDTPTAHLHVGWIARLDAGGAGDLDVPALRARIAARLERTPRLRAIVTRRAEGSGELVWREDPRFELDRHVVAWGGTPAGEEQLRVVVDGFLAEGLPHEHPLWRVLVVPRTRGGGALLAAKLHRAIADGHDADLLREIVFDPGPDARGPSDADLDALAEYRSTRALREGARAGAASARIGATLRRAALARTEGALVAAPPSFLDAGDGGRRTLVTARTDLARLGRIADRTETTLHDVVLAVLAGTLRRLALARGEAPRDVRALVPLRVEQRELLGDAPCAVVDLPVAEPRAAARLRAVHAAIEAAVRPDARHARTGSSPTLLAGPPEELATRLALATRVSNVTIPSAAGPAHPLRLGGTRVRALFPLASAPAEHALALGTLSYERHLHVGAAADTSALAAIGRLPVMLADAVEELGV